MREDMRGRADQRCGGFAAGAEQCDHHVQRCQIPPIRLTAQSRCENAEQVVARIGGRPLEMLDDVAGELHHRDACGRELILADKALHHFGARVSPSHQLLDVDVGHTDQSSDDHHRQPVGHRRHPLDGAVLHAFVPQPVRGLADERLQCIDPFGRQLRHQQLSVRGMGGVVGGGERLDVAAELSAFLDGLFRCSSFAKE